MHEIPIVYDECDDTCVAMDSEFYEFSINDSCLSYDLEERDKSEYVFLDLQMIQEPVMDNGLSYLRDANRACDHQTIPESLQTDFCLKGFYFSLQISDVRELCFVVQTNDQNDVFSFEREPECFLFQQVSNKEGCDVLISCSDQHSQYFSDSVLPSDDEFTDYLLFDMLKVNGNIFYLADASKNFSLPLIHVDENHLFDRGKD